MKKKRLKIDFFAILHPLFLMMLGLLFYFFAFILIWFITELAKLIEGKTDFHTLYLYSLLTETSFHSAQYHSEFSLLRSDEG